MNRKVAEPTHDQNRNPRSKTKKKEGKIQYVWELSQKGSKVKDIAKETGLSERVVRSYVWRKKNPKKYKALLARYLAKRRQKEKDEKSQLVPNEEKK